MQLLKQMTVSAARQCGITVKNAKWILAQPAGVKLGSKGQAFMTLMRDPKHRQRTRHSISDRVRANRKKAMAKATAEKKSVEAAVAKRAGR